MSITGVAPPVEVIRLVVPETLVTPDAARLAIDWVVTLFRLFESLTSCIRTRSPVATGAVVKEAAFTSAFIAAVLVV